VPGDRQALRREATPFEHLPQKRRILRNIPGVARHVGQCDQLAKFFEDGALVRLAPCPHLRSHDGAGCRRRALGQQR
jgi:hypothetical protein